MNQERKRIFEVIIKDETGKVLHNRKTDCIMAAISSPEQDGVNAIYITSCNAEVMFNCVNALNEVRKKVYEENPELRTLDLLSLLIKN